jgi:hypothetical protein
MVTWPLAVSVFLMPLSTSAWNVLCCGGTEIATRYGAACAGLQSFQAEASTGCAKPL